MRTGRGDALLGDSALQAQQRSGLAFTAKSRAGLWDEFAHSAASAEAPGRHGLDQRHEAKPNNEPLPDHRQKPLRHGSDTGREAAAATQAKSDTSK